MRFDLYHYFERTHGPFRNLSGLSEEAADAISEQIRMQGKGFASQRQPDYMRIRRELESQAREQFVAKGGRPRTTFPHYMTLSPCDWLETWYEDAGIIVIGVDTFASDAISFTYGDLFPTMRYSDGKPYRKQVYTKDEIMEIIARYGLPQDWNPDGAKGPERYIEVQVWDEEIVKAYML